MTEDPKACLMKGVFLDSHTIDQGDLDFSELVATLPQWELYPATSLSEVADRIADATIIVTNKVPITAEIMRHAAHLRCICAAATGFDHIDSRQARSRQITLCNVKGYSTSSVIQHAIGLMIDLASRLTDYHLRVRAGAWQQANLFCLQDFQTTELAGKILGIMGYGAIGQGVARVAQALGMKILIAQRGDQPQPGRVPLEILLPQVDILSLHCPLTPQTRHLIGAEQLALMKKTALVVNVSRGGLVDETALVQALQAGHLAGAAVDVSSQEPPTRDSPLLKAPPNLLVTPHVAWSTLEARKRLLKELVLNVQSYLAGKPRNVVG